MDYSQALDWIHSRERFGIRPGLERMNYILAKLGNPHRKLKVIHIGGTNGKGSTAAFAASVLEEAGFKTGLYTSPYLESFANRMAVDGCDVEEEVLVSLVKKVKPLVEEVASHTELGPPTEFEVVTILAFLYFSWVKVDYLVLEVGLGGRLDATNVVSTPLVSVITNVSLEHVEILGDTVEKIAWEKAGIIKEGIPVVTASQNEGVLQVVGEVAAKKNAPLYRMDRDFAYTSGKSSLKGQFFSYRGFGKQYTNLFTPLLGEHQTANASTALAALELAGIPIAEQEIREGLAKVFWPGRLEILRDNPLVVIDAAHNLEGIKFLCKALSVFPQGDTVVVLGILGDKSVKEILQEIVPVASRLIITKAIHPTRAADPQEVALRARRMTDGPVHAVADLSEAIREGARHASKGKLIITGSFYTISEARRLILQEKVI